jgi:hypothetical protein
MKKVLRNSLIAAGFGLMELGMVAYAKEAGSKPQFAVCVHNYAGVRLSTLRHAEKITKEIFERTGVETTWMNDASSSSDTPRDTTLEARCESAMPVMYVNLVKQIIDSDHRLSSNVLGIAFGSPEEQDRHIVHVSENVADRLIHEQKIADKSEILGHAMAHELGHILAHVHEHSPTGLMRANWQEEDFRAMTKEALNFNSEQAARIRQEVTRRTRDLATLQLAANAH